MARRYQHGSRDRGQVADFCRMHHVCKLLLSGSALREDFCPDSDADVLVEFEPGHVRRFVRLYFIEEELSGLLGGRKVELVTSKFLNPRIMSRVLAEAEVQYAQG